GDSAVARLFPVQVVGERRDAAKAPRMEVAVVEAEAPVLGLGETAGADERDAGREPGSNEAHRSSPCDGQVPLLQSERSSARSARARRGGDRMSVVVSWSRRY